MGLLTRLSAANGRVIEGRAWIDPELDAALDQLPVVTPEQTVELALAHLRPIRTDPERHVQATEAFGKHFAKNADLVRARAGYPEPDDPETAADVLALLGTTLVERAWLVRGNGLASTVSGKSFGHFHTLLEEADHALVEALRLVPGHPAAATKRLATALGAGAPEDEWWERFGVARQVRPTLYPAHRLMLTSRCAKWYGSDEAMFRFAREVAAAAPPGDPVVAMLPLAHIEYFCAMGIRLPQGSDFANAPDAVRERQADVGAVIEASRRWCGQSGRLPPPHPRGIEAHQLFAGFFMWTEGQEQLTRWHLRQSKGRMSSQPWGYIPQRNLEAFRAAHVEFGVGLGRFAR